MKLILEIGDICFGKEDGFWIFAKVNDKSPRIIIQSRTLYNLFQKYKEIKKIIKKK